MTLCGEIDLSQSRNATRKGSDGLKVTRPVKRQMRRRIGQCDEKLRRIVRERVAQLARKLDAELACSVHARAPC